jgi:hypothetical protein
MRRALVIAQTDLVVTLPRRAGSAMSQYAPVTAWPVPFDLPAYAVKQHWHEHQMRDPGNRWLRALQVEVFGNQPPPAA